MGTSTAVSAAQIIPQLYLHTHHNRVCRATASRRGKGRNSSAPAFCPPLVRCYRKTLLRRSCRRRAAGSAAITHPLLLRLDHRVILWLLVVRQDSLDLRLLILAYRHHLRAHIRRVCARIAQIPSSSSASPEESPSPSAAAPPSTQAARSSHPAASADSSSRDRRRPRPAPSSAPCHRETRTALHKATAPVRVAELRNVIIFIGNSLFQRRYRTSSSGGSFFPYRRRPRQNLFSNPLRNILQPRFSSPWAPRSDSKLYGSP